MNPHRRPARLATGLALLLLLCAAPVPRADEARLEDGPVVARGGFAAVALGGKVHLFGGFVSGLGSTDDVLVLDPVARTLTASPARLPVLGDLLQGVADPRPTAACPAGCAYVFGAFDPATRENLVLRYVPEPPSVTVAARWSTGGFVRTFSNAVWTGEQVVLVGGTGCGSTAPCAEATLFHPLTDEVRALPLPAPRDGASAAWGGDAVYAFGGFPCASAVPGTSDCDEVLRVDPREGTAQTLPAALPFPMTDGAAYWDGGRVFVVGGRDDAVGARRDVLKFDPQERRFTAMSARLPVPFADGHALWMGDHALLLKGGSAPIRHSLRPAEPSAVTVSFDTRGAAVVRWIPPPESTYSVLTEHRVYRVSLLDGAESLAGVAGARDTFFVDDGHAFGTHAYHVSAVNAGRDESPRAKAALAGIAGPVLP